MQKNPQNSCKKVRERSTFFPPHKDYKTCFNVTDWMGDVVQWVYLYSALTILIKLLCFQYRPKILPALNQKKSLWN